MGKAKEIDFSEAIEATLTHEYGAANVTGVEGYLNSLYYEEKGEQYVVVSFVTRENHHDVVHRTYKLVEVKRGGQQ